ncbi:RDD family protein [Arenicella xantha]|uniref:Putative RDD family membrane protein YckC n=1 Tax=Arenicella xantha TaxID=644221 RepID=A0A395JLT1_9GAMM|nr:RDD family protein [Arenicella xantha]RBP51756.1 putative RDD family membrane protein YckC [Arenicella xantha]
MVNQETPVETGDMRATLLRLPAGLIDFAVVMLAIVAVNKLAIKLHWTSEMFAVEVIMLLCIPLGFFVYWACNIHLGKRLFGLRIVDAETGKKPSPFQYFRRCLPFALLVSLNVVFLIPLFAAKRNRGFQDMFAHTVVVRKTSA